MFIWLRITVATPTIMMQIFHVILTPYLKSWNGPYMLAGKIEIRLSCYHTRRRITTCRRWQSDHRPPFSSPSLLFSSLTCILMLFDHPDNSQPKTTIWMFSCLLIFNLHIKLCVSFLDSLIPCFSSGLNFTYHSSTTCGILKNIIPVNSVGLIYLVSFSSLPDIYTVRQLYNETEVIE
jgi:hypothetical protein